MNLKEQTVSGIIWSFIDNSLTQIITFIVGIVLARLLSPAEFGLIGMIAIFIAVSEGLVDSGFSQALIRKIDCSEKDYNTVFYFNIFISMIIYLLLFFLSPYIAEFFKEPKLIEIIRVLSLSVLINAIGLVQLTQLNKNIKIKIQTKISVMANICSGTLAIYFAYNGFGVWSLVLRNLINYSIRNFLYWFYNNWRPKIIFSLKSFKEMYAFGSKLLISGIINRIFENLYYFVIGKYFSAEQLGYYTRADTFAKLPSSNLNGVIQRISYPVLAKLQNNDELLKSGLRKLIKSTMFITFIMMMLLAATSESMVLTLIGEKWRQSISYLQMLCFVFMFFPLHSLNLNMLNVKGRSDLFLKLEIIKKIVAVPVVITGIVFGIYAMITGMIISSFIAYYLNSYYTGKLIKYNVKQQLSDIFPSFLLASLIGTITFISGQIINTKPFFLFIFQTLIGLMFVFTFSEIVKLEPYLEIKSIVISKLRNRIPNNDK